MCHPWLRDRYCRLVLTIREKFKFNRGRFVVSGAFNRREERISEILLSMDDVKQDNKSKKEAKKVKEARAVVVYRIVL